MVQQHDENASPYSALTLFYCYAREDQALRDKIDVHLAALHRSGLITSWHDAMIIPGQDWEHEIDTHLNAASIILLLVSPDFLHSDYCYGREMKRAIERHKKGEAHVIPILLRPVDREDTPFSALQMLPTDAKPVTQWPDRDAAFADIAWGIRRAVNAIIALKRLHEAEQKRLQEEEPRRLQAETLIEQGKVLEEQKTASHGTLPPPPPAKAQPPSASTTSHPYPYPHIEIQNHSSGSIHHLNIANRDVIVNYPPREFRLFRERRSRRLFLTSLAGLVGLTIVGSITWSKLSQQSSAPSSPVLRGTVLSIYSGHSDWITAVTWSPDSKRIASASADKTVQVWDARSGRQIYKYPGHSDFVYAVAWSPDGTRIASGSSDGTAQVWDPADNGRRISTYHGHANAEFGVQSLAWSPDGTRIASAGSDGMVQVWYAADGVQIFTHTGHASGQNGIAWSPHDGKYIAFGSSDTTVQVWDANNGTLVNTYHGHSKRVKAVAWSPDGKYIASGSEDNSMHVWKAIDSTNVHIYGGHTYWVDAVAWSPDGKRIISGSGDTTVRMWEAENGKQVYLYTKYSDPVDAVAWSPDGTLIASGGGFPGRGTVQVWGTENKEGLVN